MRRYCNVDEREIKLDPGIRDRILDVLNDDESPEHEKCPICQYTMAHIQILPLSENDTHTRQGGYLILIEGECGHTWGTIYAAHKGDLVRAPFIGEDHLYLTAHFQNDESC